MRSLTAAPAVTRNLTDDGQLTRCGAPPPQPPQRIRRQVEGAEGDVVGRETRVSRQAPFGIVRPNRTRQRRTVSSRNSVPRLCSRS